MVCIHSDRHMKENTFDWRRTFLSWPDLKGLQKHVYLFFNREEFCFTKQLNVAEC